MFLPQTDPWIPDRKKVVGGVVMNLLLVPSLLALVALLGFVVVQAVLKFGA